MFFRSAQHSIVSSPGEKSMKEDDGVSDSARSMRSKPIRRRGPHRSFGTNDRLTVVFLSLGGCILFLLVIIAWLVLLLLSSSQNDRENLHKEAAMQVYVRNHPWKDDIGPEATDMPDPLSSSSFRRNHRNDTVSFRNSEPKAAAATPAAYQIVWLMSFPNSGTSYTSRLVRDTTQTFTASNYADETPEGRQGIVQPVFANETRGPFWIIPTASQDTFTKPPSNLVLTKTHCGIRCSLCSPNEYAETTYSFRRRCLVTKWIRRDAHGQLHAEYSTYAPEHVVKAVHLLRNPFDNVVSRFHLERAVPNSTASAYAPNRRGFLRYCLAIDFHYTKQEIEYLHFQENQLLQDLWKVPCHADFLKYVEWHNLAFYTTDDGALPTLLVHYDDYRTRAVAVRDELLSFLGLVATADPPPFAAGTSYADYYTREEQGIVKRAFAFMASRKTWEQVQRYFPPDDG